MALYAFDGTGNEDRPGDQRDSNVLRFFRAYVDPLKNDDVKQERGSLYLEGIGARAHTLAGEALAKAFGFHGHRRVRQALDRLENNLEANDDVIDIVGFSRGAALAVSFANEACKKVPGVKIRFVGLWDLVGQFGLPGERLNAGHDLDCPDAQVYHAMALDEARPLFPLTRLARQTDPGKLREVWFRGVHSDVGGGNENPGLYWISLNWMFENARRHGLPIDPAAIAANLADRTGPGAVTVRDRKIEHERRLFPQDVLHVSVTCTAEELTRRGRGNVLQLTRIDDAGQFSPFAARAAGQAG